MATELSQQLKSLIEEIVGPYLGNLKALITHITSTNKHQPPTELTQQQKSQMEALLVSDSNQMETLIKDMMSTNKDQRSELTQQLMDIILDSTQLETLITDLLISTNQYKRSQAEVLFYLCKQHRPVFLYVKLVVHSRSCPNLDARAGCNFLLRFILTGHDSVVVLPASCTLPGHLPFQLKSVNSDDPDLQGMSLSLLAKLALCLGESVILSHLDTLRHLFLQYLRGYSAVVNGDVGLATLRSTIVTIQCLSSDSDRDKFKVVLPPMMLIRRELVVTRVFAPEALELLYDLAGTHPLFFQGHFWTV